MILSILLGLWCSGWLITVFNQRHEINKAIGVVSFGWRLFYWFFVLILMFFLWWLVLFFDTK